MQTQYALRLHGQTVAVFLGPSSPADLSDDRLIAMIEPSIDPAYQGQPYVARSQLHLAIVIPAHGAFTAELVLQVVYVN